MLQSPDRRNYSHAHEETGEVEMIPEIIQDHIDDNRVIADNTRQICVDGRYEVTQNMGALARPGATAGYVEALLSCKKNHPEIVELNSVRKCLDLVVRFIRSK